VRRLFAWALLVTAAALCLSACGGSGSGSTASSQTSASTTEKSKLPHYEGGEKSVEAFGSEAGGSDREAVLAAEQGYLGAIAERDYEAACSHLSSQPRRSLRQLAAGKKTVQCPQILPALLSSSAAATARRQAAGTVTKVRVRGDQAFIVFHAPGAKLYVFTMVREGGEWKAAAIAGSVLVPSAATLGTG
jgi:hypothetical protein